MPIYIPTYARSYAAYGTATLPKLAAPTGLSVQPLTGINRVSHNARANARAYRLQRAPVTNGVPGSYGTINNDGTAITYDDTTSTPEADYLYRVKALGTTGYADSDYSEPVAVRSASTTPMPPTWSFDNSLRILSLAHSTYSASELEYSYNGAPYQQYTAGLSVDDNEHPAGQWKGRVKAAAAGRSAPSQKAA